MAGTYVMTSGQFAVRYDDGGSPRTCMVNAVIMDNAVTTDVKFLVSTGAGVPQWKDESDCTIIE